MIRICPSILNANFDDLPGEIAKIASVADFLHLDVMDDVFVPNFTFSPESATQIISSSTLPVDVHLMISDVDRSVEPYLKTSATSITIHLEASQQPDVTLERIQKSGFRSGLAIKPATPFEAVIELLPLVDMILVMTVEPGFGGQSFMHEMMPKVESANKYLSEKGFSRTWIQVDGGISPETIAIARKAGADTFVAGSAVYKSSDPAAMVEKLRAIAQEING
jgi:ribulose-phosphate 3-epimerase